VSLTLLYNPQHSRVTIILHRFFLTQPFLFVEKAGDISSFVCLWHFFLPSPLQRSSNLGGLLTPSQTSKSPFQPLADSPSGGVAPSHATFNLGRFQCIPYRLSNAHKISVVSTGTSLASRSRFVLWWLHFVCIAIGDDSSGLECVFFQGLLN